MPDITNYPERYIADDSRPEYFDYVARPATYLGASTEGASLVDGTIIASKRDSLFNRENYWLDPDMVMNGESVVHFIWLRDCWQILQVPSVSWRRCRSRVDIELSFAAKGVKA